MSNPVTYDANGSEVGKCRPGGTGVGWGRDSVAMWIFRVVPNQRYKIF
jgi:hypothetical protein